MRNAWDWVGYLSFVTVLAWGAGALQSCGAIGSSTTTTYSVTTHQLNQARMALAIPKCQSAGSNYTALGVKFSPNGGTVTVTCNPLGVLD